MLDMISMLTLLNSGKEEEKGGEATTNTLKHFQHEQRGRDVGHD